VEALPLAALAADEPGDADGWWRCAAPGCGAWAMARLPRAALASRFGRALVRRLARLLGEEEAPFQPISPPAPIHARRRFAEPVGRDADVLAAVGALVEETGRTLARRGLGGRRFALALERSDGHVARLAIDTAAPPRPALVLRLLRERIDSLADPLDPGFGYDAIALAVPLAEPLDERRIGWTPKSTAPPLAELLDRLAVRHGAQRVVHLAAANSHVPERAAALIAHGAQAPPALPPATGSPSPASRPRARCCCSIRRSG
jgi:protein ImuB